MDRVTNISWRTSNGATLGGFAYEYDAVGRITSRSHALGDLSQPSSPMSQSSQKSYTYDDFDRLASDGDLAYTYDAAGNRMTRTEDGDTITYTLGVGDRLASYGRADSMNPPQSGSYAYDAAGNVTRIERDGRPTLDLTWNSLYQLVSVSTNGVFAEGYAYDALSRRVSTTTLEGTTRHVYDDNWQVIADIDENGNVIASYAWGEGIDKLLAVTVGGSTYYALADIQGTVWGYVDSQNNIVARWQYDAWGNVLDEEVALSAAALVALRYRFQGREWSTATGLVNFRMRWYDSETGRWLSKDPIGLSGGLNLYAFCDDDPTGKKDPLGLCDSKKQKPKIKVDVPNGLLESIKTTLPEGALDVVGRTASATAVGTAKTTAQTLGAVPDVARIVMAAKDIKAMTELLAEDPEKAIESKHQQLESREKSLRDKLRDFFTRGK